MRPLRRKRGRPAKTAVLGSVPAVQAVALAPGDRFRILGRRGPVYRLKAAYRRRGRVYVDAVELGGDGRTGKQVTFFVEGRPYAHPAAPERLMRPQRLERLGDDQAARSSSPARAASSRGTDSSQ